MRHLLRGLVALAVGGATLVLVPAAAPADPPPPTAPGSITARAGGDRDPATGDPVPLEGAVLRAYTDAALTTPAGGSEQRMFAGGGRSTWQPDR